MNQQLEPAPWSRGLPLELLKDPQLNVPASGRETWLKRWHDERAWFEAVHRTRYCNGIIGLAEELLRVETPYDSLSFVPTILNLMGRPEPDLPGPAIRELMPY